MSHLLSAKKISKRFNTVTLFDQIDFQMQSSKIVGLVGRNGVGKSTFLKVLACICPADSGEVILSNHSTIGYLPQEPTTAVDTTITVKHYLEDTAANLGALSDALSTLATRLEQNPSDPVLLEEFGNTQELFEKQGGYSLDHRMESILEGLNLDKNTLNSQFVSISGGQRSRVALGALLLQQPDFLLLDEPTNHLDIQGLEWLENYLTEYPGGVVITSHDRKFLDRTTNAIIELQDNGSQPVRFGGNYSEYLKEKKAVLKRMEASHQNHLEEIQKQKKIVSSQTFSKKNPTKIRDKNKLAYDRQGERHQQKEARTIAQAREKLNTLQKTVPQRPPKKIESWLRFQPNLLRSSCGLEIHNLEFTYGEKPFICGISKRFYNGDRICISGKNGCGKSTLLKLLARKISPQSGKIDLARTASIAYLSQHAENLSLTNSVLEEYQTSRNADLATLRKELAVCGLFGDERVHMKVADLSCGQKQKLQLAKLAASNANVLLLDEPTNHLDLVTLEELEAALIHFHGIIIFTSHDRWFIEKVATTIWSPYKP